MGGRIHRSCEDIFGQNVELSIAIKKGGQIWQRPNPNLMFSFLNMKVSARGYRAEPNGEAG